MAGNKGSNQEATGSNPVLPTLRGSNIFDTMSVRHGVISLCLELT